jgi:peptidoglycan/LPS O-acetylase OafA/YrhL
MGLTANLPRLKPASGELLHLDLMRFVASAGIVFHHSHEFFVPAGRNPFTVREQTAGLALFVDLFFVISGFVIAYIYSERMHSLRDYGVFLQRRAARLVPLHWLTLLASIAVWSLFVRLHCAGEHTPSFRPKCIAETALLVHSFLFCGRPFNGVTWSLSAEMVMYIAFPLFAFVGAKSARLLIGLALVCLPTTVALAAYQNEWNWLSASWIDLPPVARAVPSFAFGAALFYNRERVRELPASGSLLAAATAGLLAAMIFGLPQLITLLLVYAVAIAATGADLKCRAPSAFVRRFAPLGQLTYSVYMWHLIFILILINAFGEKFLHGNLFAAAMAAAVCYIGILAVSYFSFFFIETPARRWLDGVTLFKPALTNAMPL